MVSLDPNSSSPLAVKDILSRDANNQTFDHTQAHVISASQLLANDIDWNRKVLRVSNVTDAQGGTISNIVKAADNIGITSFTFTPNAQYQGVMGFKNGNTAAMKAAVYLRTPDLPTAPLVTDQWYLSEANILPVWKDYSGKGVRIAQFELGAPFAPTDNNPISSPQNAPSVLR